ncbi:MAG: EAL domain-containing protein [Microcoleus sp. PH2017_25_DOB_D_A]|uniref:EAL domain-containing protein n=1 Tax=unclassified Microcoleus TaxID=2642155 RepID=UPI001D966E5B|nr:MULTISPECIES: EAL domain-containing protein [unclassified Microcoleus]TAE45385.1 MAG: EAL domain-containing protein [Oscillatoriales cyanobacterium]MCC3435785.1 EAL domain-containing protein [Microcoleus sp. PH2017_05_CCC_O_A]MCC3532904.1 EAL domain-containing protein [Microcoleus sp. PH2017_25_DOB_D_A]MCC3544995.1 EAL domain-containing protein [Microcoleus sp. PH2017_24_DOB_U_A]MCC3589340.1 EAL domain-containing protein [Microcoleus sp. PH2017_28_MFU_U_A]
MARRRVRQTSRANLKQEILLNRITNRIRNSLELQEILTTTAREIRSFLGSDRVKVYRFDADGSGEVIAEAINGENVPSLLGLRFPAGDIPPSAREMFVKARQRVIVDVGLQHKIINRLDCPETGQTLAVEDIRYCPVDPCHAEYLEAMGVRSSLTVPIVHQNQLWGLLACHHSQPKRFSDRELNMVQLLVDQLSIAIAQSFLLTQARQQARDEAVVNQISSLLHSPLELNEIRQAVLEQSVKHLDGSGGRLYIAAEFGDRPAKLYTCGQQPPDTNLELTEFWQQIMGWANQDEQPKTADSTSQLGIYQNLYSEHYSSIDTNISNLIVPHLYAISDIAQEPQVKSLSANFLEADIRSFLAVPLQYRQQCIGCLTIFRAAVETEILWAGRCSSDARSDRPRQSFAAWKEIKTGEAQKWSSEEQKLAKSLGTHLYMAAMQRRVEAMMRHQASHDPLTGLANRLLFNERLSLALANAHQNAEMLAVIFLDLDRFKNVNDTLGHPVGDQLLQGVSRRLTNCLRLGDSIARWGGDEFTLLLYNINSPEDATKVCQRIIQSLSTPFDFDGRELYTKASLGIALAPYDGEDAETLLKNADAAMYKAKQKGRNNYHFYTRAIGNQVSEELNLENQLYKALKQSEFVLHYQPQINLNTCQIVGMEALIRWEHPERGLIPPDRFIPLAEETGLICQIDEWVLRTACLQNREWQLLGLPPVRVAVNLSGRQFLQANTVETIAKILSETELNPEYLEIEITETVAMTDVNFTVSVLQELQQMGIQISLDDFGTGYSSLWSLKNFPLNNLKIDKSFVADLLNGNSGATIVKVAIALGQGLNLQVIAEGVETAEQLAFLQSLQCDMGQGYFFSKPIPAAAATQLYLENQLSKICSLDSQ